jgi:hypothetical protein
VAELKHLISLSGPACVGAFPRLKGRGRIEATLSQVEHLEGFHRFDIFIC